MGDLPLPTFTAAGLAGGVATTPISETSTVADEAPNPTTLLGVLRQAVIEAELPTDSILGVVANTARVVSESDGIAIATLVDGAIVCRARSGEIAPPIGSRLSSDSGISGECLRSAVTLICRDTLNDGRVDADVCRDLGIRSLIAVPLRRSNAVVGILEAFSSRPAAFANDQIKFLRGLAEIVELACEREERSFPAVSTTTTPAAQRPALFAVPLAASSPRTAPFIFRTKRFANRYWIAGAAVLAVLLIAIIVRLSWRQAGAEIAANESRSQPESSTSAAAANHPLQTVSMKPDAPVADHHSDRGNLKSSLKNAADIESANDVDKPSRSEPDIIVTSAAPKKAAVPESGADIDPPAMALASATTPNPLAEMAAGSEELPKLGVTVSQGATPPVLIDRVTPAYPPQARLEELSGSVVLDTTIGKDGAVRKVTVVSGSPVLAASAAAAVRRWRYSPGLLNGNPVETQKQVTVVFKLP